MHGFLLKIYKKLNLSKNFQVYIQRFLNDQFLIGVTGVIFNEKDEVLLFKHTYRKTSWSLPGGYLKGGEHPKAGLAREIKEESGFKVNIIKIIATTEDEDAARLDMSYYGKFAEGIFRKSSEVSEYKFFPISKLPKLISNQYEQINEGYKRFIKSEKRGFLYHFKKSIFSRYGLFFRKV
jgi:ADP-ribose pyrophosphatase YjhB (NUDIX family)